MIFFYEFVNDIEETMKLVQRDSKLDVKKSLQDTIYSKLYANLLQIQESKKVYMENQKKELGVIHQLISDISHQVKTPITTAKTYGQMKKISYLYKSNIFAVSTPKGIQLLPDSHCVYS